MSWVSYPPITEHSSYISSLIVSLVHSLLFTMLRKVMEPDIPFGVEPFSLSRNLQTLTLPTRKEKRKAIERKLLAKGTDKVLKHRTVPLLPVHFF